MFGCIMYIKVVQVEVAGKRVCQVAQLLHTGGLETVMKAATSSL